MKARTFLLTAAILFLTLMASAQLEYITNITVAQRADASGLVDVHFDLVAQPGDYNIFLFLSLDGGSTFIGSVPLEFLSGDAGPIQAGTGYHIIWDGLGSHPQSYGAQSQLKLYAADSNSDCPPAVVDIEGNIYGNIQIGEQCWMKENLKTTKYRNGSDIEYPGDDNTAWQNNTTGAYAWYDNDISWKDLYGALYNWHAVNNANGLCPEGWHVPTDEEWTVLTDYLGGISVAGGKLKSTRTEPDSHPRWESPNTGASNSSGFSGLPGGARLASGSFNALGLSSPFWTTTEYTTTKAWSRFLFNDSDNASRTEAYFKAYGFSVRCVRD